MGLDVKKWRDRLIDGAGLSVSMTSLCVSFLLIKINTGFRIYNVQESFRLEEAFQKKFNNGKNALSEQKGKQKSRHCQETSLGLVSCQVDLGYCCFSFFL